VSETAQTTRLSVRDTVAAAREWAAARWFPLGVAGIAVATAGFLFHQLLAWPPHEDEALPLLVGRNDLDGVVRIVLDERGGAPLHFLLAWAVAHADLGLGGLRALSAAFAVASVPVTALLAARLAGRVQGLAAAAVLATSWTFLFHGVYGRMYSLFLLTSTFSYLALLRALERGGRRAWALWATAILATVATHPYGALVLASQGVYVVLARRDRLHEAGWAFGAVAVLGIPFWLTDLVLAGRFDAGVAGGGRIDVFTYMWRATGDFTAGFPVLPAVLVAAAAGLAVLPRAARLLTACAAVVPLLALDLFEWEPEIRQEARAEAAAYLAATTGPDDVLLGYDPLFVQSREQGGDPPLVVLPRADADLALHNLLSLDRPLGHGVWVFDASKTTNADRSLEIPLVSPRPAAAFEVRDFGPFLVIRTRAPVLTPERYLLRAGQAMLVGKRLFLGDADINLPTIERAARALRGYGADRSLSTSSR